METGRSINLAFHGGKKTSESTFFILYFYARTFIETRGKYAATRGATRRVSGGMHRHVGKTYREHPRGTNFQGSIRIAEQGRNNEVFKG